MVGEFLLYIYEQELGNLQLHDLNAILVVHGDREPYRFGRTVTFLKYVNNAISHILLVYAHRMEPTKCCISLLCLQISMLCNKFHNFLYTQLAIVTHHQLLIRVMISV